MPAERPNPDEVRMELFLGNLLRVGVVIAALVIAAGGAVFLARHGTEPVEYARFRGEPAGLTHPVGIVREVFAWHGRAVIQFGLLLLIATPVLRVAFSVVGFLRERDWTYVVLTLVVLGVLLFSLFHAPG